MSSVTGFLFCLLKTCGFLPLEKHHFFLEAEIVLLLNLIIDQDSFVPSVYAVDTQLAVASANKYIKILFCVTFRNQFGSTNIDKERNI
jgi:hypothetical protein